MVLGWTFAILNYCGEDNHGDDQYEYVNKVKVDPEA